MDIVDGSNYIALYSIYLELDDFDDKENFVKFCRIPELYEFYIEDNRNKLRTGDMLVNLKNLIEDNDDESFIINAIHNFGRSLCPSAVSLSIGNDYEINSTALIYACNKKMENVALKIIDSFKDECSITQEGYIRTSQSYPFINKNGQCTAFSFAIRNRMDKLVYKMYDVYGELLMVKPTVDNESNIVIFDIINNGYDELLLDMIEKYPNKCYPSFLNTDESTILIKACSKEFSVIALKLIDTFGYKCNPQQADIDGDTAFIYAVLHGLNKVVSTMIECFGNDCIPKQKDYNGDSAITIAIYANEFEIAMMILEAFGLECIPDNEYNKVLKCAKIHNMVIYDKIIDLLQKSDVEIDLSDFSNSSNH